MQIPPFDTAKRQWDRYKTFYIQHRGSGFVDLETGESMFVIPDPRPDWRGNWASRNVQIVSTTDTTCPALYHPETGERLVSTHLSRYGQQMLAVDRDFNMAVRIMGYVQRGAASNPVPAHLRQHAHVYWAGPGSRPVGAPIQLRPPTALSPEEVAQMTALKASCEAWATMSEVRWDYGGVAVVGGERIPFESAQLDLAAVRGKTIADLSPPIRLRLLAKGIAPSYNLIEIPFAVVKPT